MVKRFGPRGAVRHTTWCRRCFCVFVWVGLRGARKPRGTQRWSCGLARLVQRQRRGQEVCRGPRLTPHHVPAYAACASGAEGCKTGALRAVCTSHPQVCVCVCVHTGALLSAWLLWARSAQHIESCDKLGQLHAYRPAVNTPL